MTTDSPLSSAARARLGSVAGLWRYPVKSMTEEELNASDVTKYGFTGDRKLAVTDPVTGKVAGAKNPREWGSFFEFRAACTGPPRAGARLPAVRRVMTTLPQGDLPEDSRILRTAAQHNHSNAGACANVIAGGTIRRGDPVRLT